MCAWKKIGVFACTAIDSYDLAYVYKLSLSNIHVLTQNNFAAGTSIYAKTLLCKFEVSLELGRKSVSINHVCYKLELCLLFQFIRAV